LYYQDPANSAEGKNSKDYHNIGKLCSPTSNMEDKKVRQFFLKSDFPIDRKGICIPWVFAGKDHGKFRARSVAKGLAQVPCKDCK
jgi:hypothetical protein